jgi:hypothetical protein
MPTPGERPSTVHHADSVVPRPCPLAMAARPLNDGQEELVFPVFLSEALDEASRRQITNGAKTHH